MKNIQSKHYDFIMTPIFSVLKEASIALQGISSGMQAHPVMDYFLQSVFLKMTGFNEQKLKCICWDIATNDYDYRYHFLNSNYHECSALGDKNKVFAVLIGQIFNNENSFTIEKAEKNKLFEDEATKLISLLKNSNLNNFNYKDFTELEKFCSNNENKTLLENEFAFVNKDKISDSKIIKGSKDTKDKSIYYSTFDALYRHRNRCAHNTRSYQQNLPDFSELSKSACKGENYFLYFFMLVLIDDIFRRLYEKYNQI